MKTTLKILAVLVAMVGFSAASYAQTNTATATASGVILRPLTITNDVNMNFGNIASSASLGTITVAPSAAGTITASGGASVATPAGSPTAAKYTLSGFESMAFTVTLPTGDHTVKSGTNDMIVNTFTSSITGTTSGGSTTLVSGAYTLYVGATLNVKASQAVGTYVSDGTFSVTVNYN